MNQKFDPTQSWSKVIRERAARLGKSEREAAEPIESQYLAALKSKAERLGGSVDEVREINKSATPRYPTPECILPSELTDFVNGEDLDEDLILHLGECEGCCALLQMAAPSTVVLKRLVEEVRIRLGEQAINSDADLSQLFERTAARTA